MRPFAPADLRAAHELFATERSAARYLSRTPELLDDAAAGRGERLAFVAQEGKTLNGVLLAGAIAGSEGAAAITALCVRAASRRRGTGSALVHAACRALLAQGARLIVVELAGDPLLAPARALFLDGGFTESGRVPGLYADGVDLVILERRSTR